MLTLGLGIAAALTTLAIRRLRHASQTVDRILAEEPPAVETHNTRTPAEGDDSPSVIEMPSPARWELDSE